MIRITISTHGIVCLMVAAAVSVSCLADTASGSQLCLTKKQARELWPKKHIYWYSRHHCWSNRRGPPRNLRMDPIINSNAMAKDSSAKTKTEDLDRCCWPVLDRDAEGNIIEPPRSFTDRWQDQPWIGRVK
jgi:hypothetical protein